MIAACLFVPLTILTYCYVKIIKFYNKSQKIVRAPSSNCPKSGEISLCCSVTTDSARSRCNLTQTTMTLIVVFALCWSPFALIMIIQVFFKVNVSRYIDFGSLVFGYINSLCNVFVYNSTNRNIRRGFKKFFRKERATRAPFLLRKENE